MHPRLTFIVPVYKPKPAVFERCLKSLLAQSLKSWELIVVLDGPCSEARGVLARVMHHAKVPWQVHEIAHGGACAARNAGAKFASGDFWVFLDDDVYIEPDAAKMWVDTFDKQPEIGFIYSGYRFTGEKGGIESQLFDPWTLRVRNYISSCFPIRREFFPGWDESLDSLQDWSYWLSAVAKGAKGLFVPGYAFATEYPDADSLSGRGCRDDVWLSRVDAVKKLHGLPEREVCVSSLSHKLDGIKLAKLIDADYQDFPNFKPHRYKTIIQVGFNLQPGKAEQHASIFGQRNNSTVTKRVLFWTADNLLDMRTKVSWDALESYGTLLNATASQYVEDLQAQKLIGRFFNAQVMPLPLTNTEALHPLPAKPKFAVDIQDVYGHVFVALEKSLPDIELEVLRHDRQVKDYTGLLHFYSDRSMTNGIKRMILSGRHVISNVQQPFAGFIDDRDSTEKFIVQAVEKVRAAAKKPSNVNAVEYWNKAAAPDKLLEALKA